MVYICTREFEPTPNLEIKILKPLNFYTKTASSATYKELLTEK